MIARLAAAFGVEWRAIEDELAVTRGDFIAHLAVGDDGFQDAFVAGACIAKEAGRADLVANPEPDRLGGGVART